MAALRIAMSLLAMVGYCNAKSNSQDCAIAGPGFPSPSRLSDSEGLAEAIADLEKLTSTFKDNDTAWTVALFSSKENKTLYERYHTPLIDLGGVSKVDKDSVFRIASVSKVFSVWTFLNEVGDEHFNTPITKYLPELREETNSSQYDQKYVYDDINRIRWEEITLGELASHAAGIPRDPTQGDLSVELDPEMAQAFGFPKLNSSEIPVCGVVGSTRPCNRKEMLSYLKSQRPLLSTSHSPAYTNVAYGLLGMAQEAITGTPAQKAVEEGIFEALGMTNSAYKKPPPNGGVIPGGDASAVGWNFDYGPTSPGGSIYSSTSDLIIAGQAILQSKLLATDQTRRWLKPHMQTSHLGAAVGAPWEIRYLSLPNDRLTQLYSKQGDISGYRAAFVLSPEHNLGWVVLAASPPDSDAAAIREKLMNAFGNIILPAAEEQSQKEAEDAFSGTYIDKVTNSTAEIHIDQRPGLTTTNLVSRGVQIIGPESPLVSIYGAGQFAKLYPSNLRSLSMGKRGDNTYESRVGFRATFFNQTRDGQVQDPCLMSWTALGAVPYGQVPLDDWMFEMGENGQAKVLNVQMLRLRLEKSKD